MLHVLEVLCLGAHCINRDHEPDQAVARLEGIEWTRWGFPYQAREDNMKRCISVVDEMLHFINVPTLCIIHCVVPLCTDGPIYSQYYNYFCGTLSIWVLNINV